MKKTLILALVLLSAGSIFGQRYNQNHNQVYNRDVIRQSAPLMQLGNNEFRFNLAYAIAGLPEISYERFIADNMGIGLSAAFSLEKAEDMSLRSILIPYYRLYFGQKKASGFFIEGNMGFVNIRNSYVYDGGWGSSYLGDLNSYVGFGAAIGFKLLTRNGFVGEVYLGGGRNVGNSDDGGYPRIGITIGKRF